MIKDPYCGEETPYEFLGIDPDTPKNALHQVRIKCMSNPNMRPKLNKVQEAIKRLSDPEERTMIDILLYRMKMLNEGEQNAHHTLYLDDLYAVPLMALENLYTDLQRVDLDADVQEIRFSEPKFTDLKKYDEHEVFIPSIQFDI